MGKMPTHGGPRDPIADLRRRIEKLEAAQRRAQSSSAFLENATIGKGGLTVKGEGGIKMVAPDGTTIFEASCNPYNPDPDGNPQPSVFFSRNDGTIAMALEDPIPDEDGYFQILRIYDRAGHEIFAEDATAGQGIANPWIPLMMYPTRYTDWPTSTSSTFEDIWGCQFAAKNPTLTLGAKYTSDASGTTGECRFQLNGTTIGNTQAFGFGIGTTYLASYVDLPAGVSVNDFVSVTLQVRRTGGTGNVMAAPFATTGSQSL